MDECCHHNGDDLGGSAMICSTNFHFKDGHTTHVTSFFVIVFCDGSREYVIEAPFHSVIRQCDIEKIVDVIPSDHEDEIAQIG